MNQQAKTALGWTAIIAVCLAPVFFWFALGPGGKDFYNFGISTHSLGELFGLIAITMFALNFVLSTRLKFIENIFGGLDKVYIVHGIIGGTALILALSHPIFLITNKIQTNISLAAEYLLPGKFWSVNFGIIALTGLLILVYITLFSKMKYHKWKFTHEFMGLVFVFAVLHMFLVRDTVATDIIFRGYFLFAGIVAGIGLSAFTYSLFLKKRFVKNAVYAIKSIEKKDRNFILDLEPEHKPLSYKSGQFVFLRFYNQHLLKEAHPFSIASKTNSNNLRIIIKKLGDYTSKIENLKVGEKVSIEGPYGKFHFQNFDKKDQVWIAAGIGITPFIGMIEDIREKEPGVKVSLFYTFKDESDFIIDDLFISGGIKNLNFISWDSSKKGRLTAEKIKEMAGGNLENKEILICGPARFKEEIINNLLSLGIKKNNIHEEVFDFR